MTTVRDITQWLNRFAPTSLAEPWDNVGLIWGDPDARVERVMTCLTVTPRTALEAVHGKAELIVSHHPVLFKPVKKIVANLPENGMLWTLARAGVSVASPHTAFDNTSGGINDGLALHLGLIDFKPLRPAMLPATLKLVVFSPESDRESLLESAFSAGAGRIGAYEQCSYNEAGQGTFFGGEGSNPTLGLAGRRETVPEIRLELICPANRLSEVIIAIRAAHSYEQPAIDVYPLHPLPGTSGAGRIGRLPRPLSLLEFARGVSHILNSPALQFAGEPTRPVQTVAIVCGAGDDFLPDAVREGADVLLTGEARFHRALEAESLGIGLIVAGHHATERPGVEDLAIRLVSEFPELQIWPSARERDPLHAISESIKPS